MRASTLRRRKRGTCSSYPAPHAFVTTNGYNCSSCPLPRGNAVHDSTEPHLLEDPPEDYR